MPRHPVIPAAPIRDAHMPPDNHAGMVGIALITCLPLGLMALWHSRRVSRCWQAQDREGALCASRAAWAWSVRSALMPALLFLFFMLYNAFWGLNDRYRTYAFYQEMNALLYGTDSELPCEEANEETEEDSEELEEEGE